MKLALLAQLLCLISWASAFTPSAPSHHRSSTAQLSQLRSSRSPAFSGELLPGLLHPHTHGSQRLLSSTGPGPRPLRASRKAAVLGLQAQIQFADAVVEVLNRKFNPGAVARVTKCWKGMDEGHYVKDYIEELDTYQECNSFVDDLSVKPFHDAYEYEWAKGLRDNAHIIQEEFKRVAISGESELMQKGNNVWVTVEDETIADSYGPGWKTLGLMDRCMWDSNNRELFPETAKLIEELHVPCSEAFFARMLPGSSIKPHSDFCNFVLTSHLGVDVPEGQCWIGVGNEKREWKNGEVLLFDTSLMHEAENNADKMRYILMFRIWHPELSRSEVNAIQYIFSVLEQPERVEQDLMTLAPELLNPIPKAKDPFDFDNQQNPAGNRKARRKAQKKVKKSSGGGGFG